MLDPADELTDDMVEFVRQPPAAVSDATIDRAGESLGVVYVDTTLTDDIESEGYAREVIRRVQEMRKELELDIEEPIRLEYTIADDRIAQLVSEHDSLIANEVRAKEVGPVEEGYQESWDIEDTTVDIAITSLREAPA